MPTKYSELSDEVKRNIEWIGFIKRILYRHETDVPKLVEGTAKVLVKYFPNMKVSIPNPYNMFTEPILGARLYDPERGNGIIDYNGKFLSDIVKIMNLDIYAMTFAPTYAEYERGCKLIFEEKEMESGARTIIGKETGKFLKKDIPFTEINVWPKSEENGSIFSNIIKDLETEFEEQILRL